MVFRRRGEEKRMLSPNILTGSGDYVLAALSVIVVIGATVLVVRFTPVLNLFLYRQSAAGAEELQTIEHFRQIADNLPVVLALANADLTQFLYVNRAYEEIWGRPVETIYANAMSFADGVHPDDRERLKEALEGLIKGEPIE
jgi:PAS domain-containing protein